MKYAIKDTQTLEIVANRGTKPSAEKWCAKLSEGLKGRYIVVKVA